MPFCEVNKYQKREDGSISNNAVRIFYQTYGRGLTKVLLITGLAGTHDSWGPQIKGLAGTDAPNNQEERGHPTSVASAGPESNGSGGDTGSQDGGCMWEDGDIEVCSFDNRGMGRSCVPKDKSDYTTTIMAKDALALMDHLGWKKAHVFGHSMGGMIASKLASIAPERVLSLALLNVTGGGFECFPKVDRKFISIAMRFMKAKTPEERATVDLDTHYTEEYLNERIGVHTRRKILHQEYVKGISSTGMQSSHGFEGQVNACWTHNMTQKDYDILCSSGFLVSVIHGRDDIIAQVSHARRIAEKLYPVAKMIELDGAHLVSHEKPEEVNEALTDLIKASESKLEASEWTNLFKMGSGEEITALSWIKKTSGFLSTHTLDYVMKLQLSFLYLFGLFVMLLDHGRNTVQNLKPVKVAASAT
ncbi:uncharacterized protein LOC116260768 isoform X2 [Nymphaea colorata]|uniref:uncharacterized protein LOC116260768 isoform X2 n=1 Tax=Nymphaea colorata TaxID=210225 RepID=UPI00214EC3D6|nr:uncharacterized protein LOC116260768 isoform X2 [Nymphaea colorata]